MPISRVWIARLACARAACLLALASGCAANTGEHPPAHSSSFDPVRGKLADGSAADTLYWRYRVNDGKATAIDAAGDTVLFHDEEVIASNGRITSSGSAVLDSGSQQQTQTNHQVDRVSAKSPAVVNERTIDLSTSSTSGEKMKRTTDLMFSPGRPTFDRSDLDSFEVGHSETQELTVKLKLTVSVSEPDLSSAPTSTSEQTATVSYTWTVVDKLASIEVGGQSYANVVQVQVEVSSTADPAGGKSTAMQWMAKGVGMVRNEGPNTGLGITLRSDLVDTNLVPP